MTSAFWVWILGVGSHYRIPSLVRSAPHHRSLPGSVWPRPGQRVRGLTRRQMVRAEDTAPAAEGVLVPDASRRVMATEPVRATDVSLGSSPRA